MIAEQGLPQRSILEPLLSIIFRNELPEITENETVMFTDDISLT